MSTLNIVAFVLCVVIAVVQSRGLVFEDAYTDLDIAPAASKRSEISVPKDLPQTDGITFKEDGSNEDLNKNPQDTKVSVGSRTSIRTTNGCPVGYIRIRTICRPAH